MNVNTVLLGLLWGQLGNIITQYLSIVVQDLDRESETGTNHIIFTIPHASYL